MARELAARLYDRLRALYVRSKRRSGPGDRVRPLFKFAEKEVGTWSTWFPMPVARRIWLWRRGFFSYRDRVYELTPETADNYLSDYQRERTACINEPWATAVDNKLLFHCLTLPYDVFDGHRAAVYGIVDHGQFHPFDEQGAPALTAPVDGGQSHTASGVVASRTRDAVAWLSEHLSDGEAVFLKPVDSGGGNGVERLRRDGDAFLVDGDPVRRRELRERLADRADALVCERVEQAPYAAELFPGTTNTIRIMTMWDPATDEPFVAAAAHRIGTRRSVPIDNWGSGGLAARVDLDTGTLRSAHRYPYDGEQEWFDRHPDTGTPIESTRIPGWTDILATVRDMARTLSHIPYLGWDIVVTDEGEFTIIEANNCPGVTVVQGHRPLLTDERVERFYAEHGIV